MQKIKDIIGNVLIDLSGQKSDMTSDWIKVWSKLGSLSKGSKPVGFKDGCLTIVVDSSARKVVLQANVAHILTTVKEAGEVQRIYYKVGKV